MIETLKQDLKPVRPLLPAWRYALGAIVFAGAILLAWLELMDHSGWAALNATTWLLMGFGLMLALASSAWTAAQWLSPTGKSSLLPTTIGLALALLGIAFATRGGEFWLVPAAQCFSLASLPAIFAGASCFLLFRRAAPQRRESVALASGLFSGLLGFLLIQLHCPIRDPGHMFLGHASLPFAWGLASYLLIKLFSKS